MNLPEAKLLADSIVDELTPFCLRVEVAGSVRRQKPSEIKDVEIVLVPNTQYLHKIAEAINHKWGIPVIGKWPAKYTKLRGYRSIDFFTATMANWGLLYFIRTGPADFGHRALSHWKRITSGGYSEGAQLYFADGRLRPTPEERDVFLALQWDYLPPEKRF